MQDMCLSTTEIRFNSRTPGGVRLLRPSELELIVEFQFTHPGRGATLPVRGRRLRRWSFNSRTPGGVRPTRGDYPSLSGAFQFTHPGRGATLNSLY